MNYIHLAVEQRLESTSSYQRLDGEGLMGTPSVQHLFFVALVGAFFSILSASSSRLAGTHLM